MTPQGRWGLSQQMPKSGEWQSVGPVGYVLREDADQEAARLDAIQPGRWRVRDRGAVLAHC